MSIRSYKAIFIVTYNKAITVVTLSPLSQSANDDDSRTPPFYQDILKFRSDKQVQLITASAEFSASQSRHKNSSSNVLLFTKPAGVLRLVAHPYNGLPSETALRLPSAQSKLEQAVFFNSVSNSLLNLQDISSFSFADSDFENAALGLSDRILRSETEHIPRTSMSVDQHIGTRLKALQAAASGDKASPEYQRLSWDALRKSITGIVNRVNIVNIKAVVPELFAENLIRGRGLFARSIMKAQASSLSYTPVFAALVAIINTKLHQVGELIFVRLVSQFRRAFKRNDKVRM